MKSTALEYVAVLAPRSAIARAVIDTLYEKEARIAAIGRDLSDFDNPAVGWSAACDLTDFDAVTYQLTRAREGLGGLTGIVNCAGSMLLKPAHSTSREDYEATVAANLTTAFAAVQAAKPVFMRDGGSVVLVSSAAASMGMGNHEAIAAAKAGIEGLARSAAATYASSGIRFNVVAPGLVETPLSQAITKAPSARKLSETLHPMGRLGTPKDIARAVCWLLDPDQEWVTGQVIGVDGGLGRVQPRPRVTSNAS